MTDINLKDFTDWLENQLENREWRFMDLFDCLILSYLKETMWLEDVDAQNFYCDRATGGVMDKLITIAVKVDRDHPITKKRMLAAIKEEFN